MVPDGTRRPNTLPKTSGRIVTARTPLDIPNFCDAIAELL